MTTPPVMSATLASRSYAALRQEGAPPWRAQSELGLQAAAAARFERLFRARSGMPGKPRFARHRQHVTAVMAEGGFPALAERRR